MSLRNRHLLLLLWMLGLTAVASACDNKKPTEESTPQTDEEYCQQNPTHCATSR